jgi:LAO/AO transport system kinase
MADLIAINKADGNNLEKAEMARRQYLNALHLFPEKESGWNPQVLTCSALDKKGIAEIWDKVESFREHTTANGYFNHRRNAQSTFWMHETIQDQMKQSFYHHPELKQKIKEFEQQVLENKMSSFVAAGELLKLYFSDVKKFG